MMKMKVEKISWLSGVLSILDRKMESAQKVETPNGTQSEKMRFADNQNFILTL